jgi:hypothetical protein
MTEGNSLVLQQSLLRRVLASRAAARLHVRFRASVVERYREMTGAQLVRTRSVGRVAVSGRWSVDVGIADGAGAGGEPEVHLPLQDLLERLPESEWPHWIEHLVEQPMSAAFLQMRISPGACIDDGDTVAWA